MPRKDLPPVLAWKINESQAVGSHRVFPPRNLLELFQQDRTHIVVDGRRSKRGIGMQTPYLTVVPQDSDTRVLWVGNQVDQNKARERLQGQLQREYERGQINSVLLVGGEHLHPVTTGTLKDAEAGELEKYGGYDRARDIVGEELLKLAEEKHLPLIAICRGSQLAINFYSDKLTVPGDHGQDEHTFIPSPEGPVLKDHKVKDVLSHSLTQQQIDSLNVRVPTVIQVNSAHAQGYRVKDISPQALEKLNANGWHLWLVANVDGIAPDDQVVEGWIRVEGNKVTGVMTQFHPERQNDEEGAAVRQFMQEVVTTNRPFARRRFLFSKPAA